MKISTRRPINRKETRDRIIKICKIMGLDVNEEALSEVLDIWINRPITKTMPEKTEFVIAEKNFEQYIWRLYFKLYYIITGGKHFEHSQEKIIMWLRIEWKNETFIGLLRNAGADFGPRNKEDIVLGFSIGGIWNGE